MQKEFEKIIEQLNIQAENSERMEMNADYFVDARMYKGKRIAFREAIEIVKQNVVEKEEPKSDDVCEWKEDKGGGMMKRLTSCDMWFDDVDKRLFYRKLKKYEDLEEQGKI